MTPEQVIADFLNDHLQSLDPGCDEIASIIWNDMLEEHSCCQAMTFQFKEELYHNILHAEYPESTPEATAAELAAEDAANEAKGLI